MGDGSGEDSLEAGVESSDQGIWGPRSPEHGLEGSAVGPRKGHPFGLVNASVLQRDAVRRGPGLRDELQGKTELNAKGSKRGHHLTVRSNVCEGLAV